MIEAATTLLLIFHRPEGVSLAAALIGLALVAVVWLSTALLQMPRHSTLRSGFDGKTWGELFLSIWVRTAPPGRARPAP